MMVLLAFLCGVLLVAWFAPAVLHRLIKRGVEPQVVLVAWGMLVGASFLTVAATLAVALVPIHGPAPPLAGLLQHCWTTLQHGSTPQAHEIVAALVLLGVLGVCALIGRGLLRHFQRQRRSHHRQVELLRVAARSEPGPVPTMWLPHTAPVAYSVAGTRGFVVASDGLRDRLGAADTAAVLEHERAHLRGRHHLLVGFADALANSAPWLPLLGHSPALVRTAVELAADRVAARAHGAPAVRSALLAMSRNSNAHMSPPHALGMAEQGIALRLRHLRAPQAATLGPSRRTLASGAAAVTAFTLPVLGGAALLVVTAMALCPVLFGS